MTRRALAYVAVLLALALAGTAAAALSPASYRSSATGICKVAKAKLNAVAVPTAASGVNPYLKKVLPIGVEQYQKLKKLSPPAPFAAAHRSILNLELIQIGGVITVIKSIDAGKDPATQFKAFAAAAQKYSDAEDAIWTKLGVPACASS